MKMAEVAAPKCFSAGSSTATYFSQQGPFSLLPIVTTGRITEVLQEGPGAYRTWFHAPSLVAGAQPGQFVNVRVGNGHVPLLRRPFSFCDIDRSSGQFSILFQVTGVGTARLAEHGPGAELSLVGPLGQGFFTTELTPASILCAGGIGVAPFPALARELAGRTRMKAVVGARTAALCLCQNDFASLDIPTVLATEDGSSGIRGFVTEPLRQLLETNKAGEVTVYACGPQPMLAAVAELCTEYGCPAQLSVEAVMGCGVGACLSCVFRTPDGRFIRSCVEGPVFRPGEVLF